MSAARLAAGASLCALVLASLAACKKPKPKEESFAKVEEKIAGDPAHGATLIDRFECARCHGGLPTASAIKPEKACVDCHERITLGTFDAPPEAIEKWRPLVSSLRFAPPLDHAERLRASWLEGFLQKPHDLRPGLVMKMPRLAMTPAEARDIAAFLTRKDTTEAAKKVAAGPALVKGNVEKGKELLASKGCLLCHQMTGGPAMTPGPAQLPLSPDKLERAMALAPDLRYARDRLSPEMLAAWIEKPSALKPDADMPDLPMTEEEARDVATFLLTAPLAPLEKKTFERLPVLSRPVRFDEVNAKVFHRTCWHCHSEPDFAIGDGGPGNSGGFGFAPRGIDLSSFQGVMAGFFERSADAEAKRKSLFTPVKDGTPRLLAALVARHAEEGMQADTGEVRGMPLGLPPLSAEDIQLVETWIAQGRPR